MVKNLPAKQPEFDPWVGKILWRRKWLRAPIFLPGKSHGQRSLADYNPWGHKESDMTEVTEDAHMQGQNTVNFFHLLGVLVSTKQLK